MNGTDIREIQELLGHENVETTMIYTHVVRELKTGARSPLDLLAVQFHRSTDGQAGRYPAGRNTGTPDERE